MLHGPLRGSPHDPGRDRVLRAALERRCEAQDLVLGPPVERYDVRDPEAPLRQRAGLVEHHRVQLAGPLERGAVADQEPLPGGEGGRHRHDQRDREAEGMRAGDHHYRHHALQREAELAARTEPRNERKRPAPDGNEREPQGGAVCEILSAGARLLRFADQLDHLGDVGVGTRPPDLDSDRALPVYGAADDLVTLALLHRLRLAGEHRLVDAGAARDDEPVSGDLLSRLDEHPVVRLQGSTGNVFKGAVGSEAMRLGRQEPDQLLEGSRGAEYRAHLDPVAEQHDVDQRRRFPEEHAPGEPEDNQRAVDVGHRDRERDEGHHPRQPLSELVDETSEERPAAVEVHGRGEAELHVAIARERKRPPETEEVLDHLGRRKDRNRERQGYPEAAAEVVHHVGVRRLILHVVIVVRVHRRRTYRTSNVSVAHLDS